MAQALGALVKRSDVSSAKVAGDPGEQRLRVGADGADSGHGPVGGDETLKLARGPVRGSLRKNHCSPLFFEWVGGWVERCVLHPECGVLVCCV